MSDRTVVVGFDALDFRYLDAFEPSLPNFSSLRAAGVDAPLRSTFPPWTASAWPSMYTGMDPCQHGVFGFFHHTTGYPDGDELVNRNHVRAPAVWNYLSALDEPAIVLNVPVTHPAEPIEGVLVPGYLAHEDDEGYPAGVRAELSETLGEPYRIYSPVETGDDADKRESHLDLIRMRGRAAAYLLAEYDWRIAVVQFQKTDTVFHDFEDRETFARTYERADEALGRVLDAAGDANVVVCSDHGMGPTDGYRVYLDEILRNAGFLEATAGAHGPSLAIEKSGLTGQRGGGSAVAERAASVATTLLGAVGLTPGDAYAAAERAGLGGLVGRLATKAAVSAASESVDWAESTAFSRGVELGVRVNLRGREPEGVVPHGEYETVRQALVGILSSLETPDGDRVFEWVRRREAVYDGPYAEHACDVLFAPADMNHELSKNMIGTEFVPVDAHGHKRDGVFLAAGPAFDGGVDLDRLGLTSVAPVAMAAAGLAVPERMTGEVPPGLLAEEVARRDYGDVEYGGEAGVGDDGSVAERLRDLGYV